MEPLEKTQIQVPRLLNRCVQTFETALSKRIFWAVMSQIKKGFNLQMDIYDEAWFDVPVKILNDYNFSRLDRATDELQKLASALIELCSSNFCLFCFHSLSIHSFPFSLFGYQFVVRFCLFG